MPERRDAASLERALRQAAAAVRWPDDTDLAPAVGARLRSQPPVPGRPWRGPRRVVAVGLAAAVLLAASVVAGVPASRHAVADWLGLGGVRITVATPQGPPHSTPPPTPAPSGRGLQLGQPATLTSAAAAVGFPMLLPRSPLVGPPDAIYVGHPPAGGQVALVYRPRPGLPPTMDPTVGLLLTEFRGAIATEGGYFEKVLGPDTTLDVVDVGGVRGGRGYWMAGHPHLFFYRDASGQVAAEDVRLAGNTLLWESRGITLRLESSLSETAVLALAASIR